MDRTTDPLRAQKELALQPVDTEETMPLPVVKRQLQTSDIELAVGSGSDPGIKRRDRPNEDSILVTYGRCLDNGRLCPGGLFVVADGMGGHTRGQEASTIAINALRDVVMPAVQHNVESETFWRELLADGVYRANLAVYKRNREQTAFMGTTMVAALVMGMAAYIVNVGDSRAYLYRKSAGLSQITQDHSIVARLVEEKAIQPEEIYTHPRRNEIYRCLGERASVHVDSFTAPLQVGDSLLLCSDGLWEMVRDPDIQELLAGADAHPLQTSDRLIQAALDGGGKDNVSVIVVNVAQNAG
jgi:serine/threonine protein phosphatase PrpC